MTGLNRSTTQFRRTRFGNEQAADAAKERDELRGAGETQKSQQFALLDELNAVQTENGNLRAQLRAKK